MKSLCISIITQLAGLKKADAMYNHYAIPNSRMLFYL